MKERGKPKYPEELHAAIQDWYLNLPFLKRSSDEMQWLLEEFPKLDPKVFDEFKELLAQSSTTDSYKERMYILATYILRSGRTVTNPSSQEAMIIESFGFQGSDAGIFSPDGAYKGELILYVWMTKSISKGM